MTLCISLLEKPEVDLQDLQTPELIPSVDTKSDLIKLL
jgi:hypothetical protein